MSRKGLACLGVWVALVSGMGTAGATVREWMMERSGIDPAQIGSLPSVRLAGLAGAGLAVPDEANELSTHDFAGNIAGLLSDTDGWVLDIWTGNFQQAYEQAIFRSERRFGHAGLRAVRASGNRALGIDVNWAFLQTDDRHGDWRKVRGPLLSALINQRVGGVTLGARVGMEQEKEDLISDDVFAVKHGQDRWIGQFGATAEALGLEWSAAWDFEQGDVVGASVDPARYHEDTYTWQRPVNRYTLALLMPRRGSLEGGLRAGWLDREGFERVAVSWSDDFPQNPSRTFYETEAVTFDESESEKELSTRWRLHLSPETILGFGAAYRSASLDVTEGVNFKGSQRTGRAADDTFAGGAGVSHRLVEGRLLATLEGAFALSQWEYEDAGSGPTEGTARRVAGLAGLEYFAGSGFVLRAGGRVASDDLDVDEPLTLLAGRAVTGGFSWLPSGGLVQIHGAVRFERSEPTDAEVTSLPEVTTVSYSLAARLLP